MPFLESHFWLISSWTAKCNNILINFILHFQPKNIFLHMPELHVKIGDFGLAKDDLSGYRDSEELLLTPSPVDVYGKKVTARGLEIFAWPRTICLVTGIQRNSYSVCLVVTSYAPGLNDLGHIVFVLPVCLSVANCNLHYNFRTVIDRDFIFGMHTPLIIAFQMTLRSMTLWPSIWPWC